MTNINFFHIVSQYEQSYAFPTCINASYVAKQQIKLIYLSALPSGLSYSCLQAMHMATGEFAENRRDGY
jgi:hypothetical protein